MKRILFFIIISTSIVLVHSCKNKKKKCTTPSTVSFKNDVQPIFDANCTTSGCHSGTNPKGNLNLEATVSYAQLMNSQSGYINTSNATSSLLYSSMNSVNNPMPPNGKLDHCTLEIIKTWIEQGAKNN